MRSYAHYRTSTVRCTHRRSLHPCAMPRAAPACPPAGARRSASRSPLTGWMKPRLAACSAWRGNPPAPRRRAAAAVDGVADQRMPGEGHVHADLVGAPGLEPALDQRRAGALRPNRSSTRARVTAGLPSRSAPPSVCGRPDAGRCRPRSGGRRPAPSDAGEVGEARLRRVGRAVGHGEVAPLEVVGGELRARGPRWAASDLATTRRPEVSLSMRWTMPGPEPPADARERPAAVVQQRVDQRAVRRCPARDARRARRACR